MAKMHRRQQLEARRKMRVRKKISGTSERPRLTVSRTLNHIYAQVVDDTTGQTLVASSSVALKIKGGNIDAAKQVGKAVAEKAQAASISRVAFDRNGMVYHGRVKALGDAAREAGLQF